MTKSTTVYPLHESVTQDHKHLVCWKSTIAGLLIALMAFMTLSALGAGIAGFTAEGLINRQEGGGSGLATGAALYLGISIVISLFCGSYFALRISGFITSKVGVAHGFVVASAFFLLLMLGLGNMIGGLASGIGGMAKAVGSGATDIGSNPAVQDALNQALGTSTLKSDPKDVAQGLTVRLLNGDTESAKNYLAYQTGQSPAEMEAKAAQLKAQFDAAAKIAGERAARAVGDAGMVAFVVFVVGLIGAAVGGGVGAHSNVRRPISVARGYPAGFAPLAGQHGNMVPYIFGWLLGVPVSLLLLIALLRGIF